MSLFFYYKLELPFEPQGGASLNCIKIIVVIEAKKIRGFFITTGIEMCMYKLLIAKILDNEEMEK